MEVDKGATFDDGHGGGGEGSSHGAVKAPPLGLKLRRGISAAKKGGLCTPVPAWKLEDAGDLESDRAAMEPKRSSVSARKLGANLWEIQDLQSDFAIGRRGHKIRRHRDCGGKVVLDDSGPEGSLIAVGDQPQSAGNVRRHAIASLIKQHKLNEANVRALEPVSPASYTSSMEIMAFNQATGPSSSKGPRGCSLKTSTELLKVLNRICSLEEQNAANVSLVKELKVELENARAHIHELMQEQHEYQHEMDNLVKQVAEDKLIRKNKEQQKVKAAVQSIRDELYDERRLRRRSESLHRKLGKELSDVKVAFLKAVKDLEVQRKANGLLEDLCDKFAESIRDYEQELRELRQKSSSDSKDKVDRLFVHISEAWLDERMQMKIAEARGDIVEKTTVTDKLRTEIETFIQTQRSRVSKVDNMYRKEPKRENNLRRQSLESVHLNGTTSAPRDVDDDDDSVASDLHCFELNMAANNEKHDGPKQNNEEEFEELYSACMENIGSSMLPKYRGNKIQSSNGKDQGSSSLHPQYLRCGSVAKALGSKFLDQNMQAKQVLAGAESSELGGQDSEMKMPRKSAVYRVHENGQDMQLKSAHLQSAHCASGELARHCSEITECCKADHDNAEEEVSPHHFSWRDHFASVAEEKAPGVFYETASPVQKWKYRGEDIELSESVARLVKDIKENTLKARLLEARREGRHDRLKVSTDCSVGAARQN